MSLSAFVIRGGPAAVLAGLLLLTALVSYVVMGPGQQETEPFAITRMGAYLFVNAAAGLSQLFMAGGLAGLYARQVQRSGWIGRAALGLAVVAAAGALMSMGALVLAPIMGSAVVGVVWAANSVCTLALAMGLLLLGWTTWRAHVLSRWNGLPLAIALATLVLGWAGNSGRASPPATGLILALGAATGLGWILLGVEMRAEARLVVQSQRAS